METDDKLVSKLKSAPIRIGEWTFYADILQLERDNKTIKLEPRAAHLLFFLAKNTGHPVSRDDLMAEVWPNLVVGDEALTGAINKLRKAFEDDSSHPEVIETIPKVGYRLIAEVEFLPTKSDLIEAAESSNIIQVNSMGKRRIIVAVSIVSIVILALAINVFWLPFSGQNNESIKSDSSSSISDKPSIAVLPFINMSNDKEQDYFVDGLTEDLITDISKISGLFVIARNSVFTFKGESINIPEVADELGVRYVLEGSVRRSGGQIRINAQLTDTTTGKHLWAERYDRQLKNVFAIQDEITASIVQALEIRLTSQEKESLVANATINFDAYELFLQGQRSFRARTEEGTSEAIAMYREAMKLDPDFSRAYGATAVAMVLQYIRGWTESPLETLNLALEMAQKAVAMKDTIPQVYWSLGYVYVFLKEFDKAAAATRRAIEISPNYADAYGLLALVYNHQGKSVEAIASIIKGMELNPYYTFDYPYNLGRAQYLAGNYVDAIDSLNKALEKNQTAVNPRIYLIASYVRQGLIDDAEWEVEQLQIQSPEITISHLRRTAPQKESLMNELVLDLRKAGLTE